MSRVAFHVTDEGFGSTAFEARGRDRVAATPRNAARRNAPQPRANAFRDGLGARIDKRGALPDEVRALIKAPGAAANRIEQGGGQPKDGVNAIRGVTAIAPGGASSTALKKHI
ncbi:hypothetical protein WS86_16895 [Burkholderia savannae]|nr:hypothetical protein WS86_16895 [Burkholderia savannae]